MSIFGSVFGEGWGDLGYLQLPEESTFVPEDSVGVGVKSSLHSAGGAGEVGAGARVGGTPCCPTQLL